MVNLSGISYDHRMTEDTGASVTDVARAWFVAREVLDFPAWWDEIGELDRRRARQSARAVPRLPAHGRAVLAVVPAAPPAAGRHRRRDRPLPRAGAERSPTSSPVACRVRSRDAVDGDGDDARTAQGVPDELAARSAVWRLLHTTFDVIEVAERAGVDAAGGGPDVLAAVRPARADVAVGRDRRPAAIRPLADPGPRRAARRPADGARRADRERARQPRAHASASWWATNERSIQRAMSQLTEIRRADSFDITNLSVALRQLRNLALTTSVRVAAGRVRSGDRRSGRPVASTGS